MEHNCHGIACYTSISQIMPYYSNDDANIKQIHTHPRLNWMLLIKFIFQTQLQDGIVPLNIHCLDRNSQSVIEFAFKIILFCFHSVYYILSSVK